MADDMMHTPPDTAGGRPKEPYKEMIVPDELKISLPDMAEMDKHAIMRYCIKCSGTSFKHGFWNGCLGEDGAITNEFIGMKLMLVVTELAEWMEAVRHDNPASDHIPEFSLAEEEAADVLIRVFDLAGSSGLRLSEALEAKMAFNEGREYMHGKTC